MCQAGFILAPLHAFLYTADNVLQATHTHKMEDKLQVKKIFFGLKFRIRIFTKTEHNVHFPYFGWKSCWLMAALPAGEWLFKIILEARKRKSSNIGLMSDEPGIEHNIHVEDEHIF